MLVYADVTEDAAGIIWSWDTAGVQSHQNKIPWHFPDIPEKLLKILDSVSSIYHFSGRLHLPYTDHSTSPFNASISSFQTYSVPSAAVFKYLTAFFLLY